MRGRSRAISWMIVGAGALTLGSCTGAMMGHYTVTGMMPLVSRSTLGEPRDTASRDPLFESAYSDAGSVD
ncbi:hypothetical protein [Sphingomonas sp. LT1P40]|uniref:hypothetical protein n=1 Tax=Alteristakelama amylovorans TaxID=3096166 RepID=UPI002FCC6AB5